MTTIDKLPDDLHKEWSQWARRYILDDLYNDKVIDGEQAKELDKTLDFDMLFWRAAKIILAVIEQEKENG